jgi:hypothetical protein
MSVPVEKTIKNYREALLEYRDASRAAFRARVRFVLGYTPERFGATLADTEAEMNLAGQLLDAAEYRLNIEHTALNSLLMKATEDELTWQ